MSRSSCALVLALLPVACQPQAAPEPLALHGATMGTTWSVKVADDIDEATAKQTIDQALEEANALFSTYRPDSELSRFNATDGSAPFPASRALADIVRLSLRVAEASAGDFDPTILPLVEVWGFGPHERDEPPSDAEVEAARERVDYHRLTVTGTGELVKARPDVAVDLSAIAKGWGVDHVVDALAKIGVHDCMVEVGGEVRCAGTKAGGAPWTIGIERPSPTGHAVARAVEVHDAAIATSGSYRNAIEVDGKLVHHILDPHTGRNAPGPVLSASVRASTCTLADALATTMMIVGPDGARAVLDHFDDPKLGVLFLEAGEDNRLQTVEVRWAD